MKSQREIYQALLAGKILRYHYAFTKMKAKLNEDGNIVADHNDDNTFVTSNIAFDNLEFWSIYKPPRIPMTLEVECTWKQVYTDHNSFVVPIFSGTFTPFIGKRTKMTLVEIIEDEK